MKKIIIMLSLITLTAVGCKSTPVASFPDRLKTDRDNFIQSVKIFNEVSDLTQPADNSPEGSSKSKELEDKIYSMTEEGINLSQKVSDEFLDYMHPELKDNYRNKLIKGEVLFLEGVRGDTANINSPGVQKQIEGVNLQAEWIKWWENHNKDLADKAYPD